MLDVLAIVCDIVKRAVDVDVASGIDEWTSVAVEFDIIPFTFYVLRDLLHVCYPVDLGI